MRKYSALLFLLTQMATALPARPPTYYKNLVPPTTPKRIISLSPATTENLAYLGFLPQLAGISQFCDRPKEVQKLPKVMGGLKPDLEAILTLRPDLVIAPNSKALAGYFSQIHQAKISLLLTRQDRLADITDQLHFLCSLSLRKAFCKRRERRFSSQIKGLRQLSRINIKDKTVLPLVSLRPLRAASGETFIGEILIKLGLKNWSPALGPHYPLVSLEALLIKTPDFVLIQSGKKSLAQAKKVLEPLLRARPYIRLLVPEESIFMRPSTSLFKDVSLFLKSLP